MPTYKISHLSTVFFVVTTLLGVTLSGFIWYQTEALSNQVKTRERNEAQQEMRKAISLLTEHIQMSAEALASWGETRQQFAFPEFYILWRDSRIWQSGVIPATVKSVALYDKHGKILAPSAPDNLMPAAIEANASQALKLENNGREYLIYTFPVYVDYHDALSTRPATIMGYAAMKFDFLATLTRLKEFRFIDAMTIRSRLPDGAIFELPSLAEHVEFELLTAPHRRLFQESAKTALIQMLIFMFAILLVAGWLLQRMIVRPLNSISMEIDALYKTAVSKPESLPAQPIHELEKVRRSFNDYQTRLIRLTSELENNSQEFYKQARQDALTGVYNRRAFDEDWMGTGIPLVRQYAFILFDCNYFKSINDSYGHTVGDAVLRAIAASLTTSLRSEDRLYRIGGDEFCTLLLGADQEKAEAVVTRCQENITAHDFSQYGLNEPVTVSIGIALSSSGKKTLKEVHKMADLAMYQAKRPGSPNIVFYNEELAAVETIVANRPVSAVFNAIKDPDNIRMRYQPIVQLPGLQPDYLEALVSISHNDELFYPGAIFPIIESRRLEIDMDLAILQAINRDLHNGRIESGLGISINLSTQGIINSKVIDALFALRNEHPTRKLVIEITETALITQFEKAATNIDQLREAGYLIALDDFGSGYSSLRYLTSMPVDVVKFDITMVRLLDSPKEEHRNMFEKIAQLVIEIGYAVVAEGIETQQQLDKINDLHFSYAQGYYLGRPE